MNKKVLKQVKGLRPGDLVFVSWWDASIGKSLSGGLAGIDVPVSSWGVFIGVLGQKNKHIIDYTAIPLSWATSVRVIEKQHVDREEAQSMVSSFLMGGRRRVPKRKRQQKVVNHDNPA